MNELYVPKIGKDLELKEAGKEKKTEAGSEIQYVRERTKSILAITLITVSVVSIILSTIYSALTGDFSPLSITILTIAPIVGLVFASYFRERSNIG